MAAVEAGRGCVLYRGIVTERRWDDSPDGYMEGRTLLRGGGEDEDVEAEIWFQNEHHVLWCGGAVAATSPDIITAVDAESAEPISNTELEVGRRVAVIGFELPRLPLRSGPRGDGASALRLQRHRLDAH